MPAMTSMQTTNARSLATRWTLLYGSVHHGWERATGRGETAATDGGGEPIGARERASGVDRFSYRAVLKPGPDVGGDEQRGEYQINEIRDERDTGSTAVP